MQKMEETVRVEAFLASLYKMMLWLIESKTFAKSKTSVTGNSPCSNFLYITSEATKTY